mgnify:FL=1
MSDDNIETTAVSNEKKPKKERKPIHIRVNISEEYEKLQSNIPVLAVTCISAFIIMAFVTFVVFLNHVQRPEKVLVPNVVGKTLEDALLEMQVKELYPKINLRYSEVPGDEGTIM